MSSECRRLDRYYGGEEKDVWKERRGKIKDQESRRSKNVR